MVGEGEDALSFEEIKRLTIAVELVANPSILFADEPTSGLESRAAMVVMRCLKNVVASVSKVLTTDFHSYKIYPEIGSNCCVPYISLLLMLQDSNYQDKALHRTQNTATDSNFDLQEKKRTQLLLRASSTANCQTAQK